LREIDLNSVVMGRLKQLDFYFSDLEKLRKKRDIDLYEVEDGVAERMLDRWKRYEKNKVLDDGLARLRYRGRYSGMDYRKYDAQSNNGLIYKVVNGEVLYRDKNGAVYGEVDELKHLHYIMRWRLGGSSKDKIFSWLRRHWFWGAIILFLMRLLKRIF
jgi:hypothetical protein